MKIKAYPKVNLCLKVYKGLSEGKHKIDSVMVLNKNIYDTIYIYKSDYLFVTYKEGGKEVSLSDCLVTKALKYLYSQHNIDVNYRIKIIKKIPYASGLGGGSADAAAVMNHILLANPNTLLDLKEIALELGSDIPFLLSRLPIARVKKHGEHVASIYNWYPKYKLHFNKIVCSTKQVFDSLTADSDYESKVNVDSFIKKHLYKQHSKNVVYNDLTKYIIQNYKELQKVYKNTPENSFFTGAGSTIVTLKD